MLSTVCPKKVVNKGPDFYIVQFNIKKLVYFKLDNCYLASAFIRVKCEKLYRLLPRYKIWISSTFTGAFYKERNGAFLVCQLDLTTILAFSTQQLNPVTQV